MDDLCEYEKKRMANIKENNDILRSLGLPVKQGKQVSKRKKKKRRRSSSVSSDEWVPGMDEFSGGGKTLRRGGSKKIINEVTLLGSQMRKSLAEVPLNAGLKVDLALQKKVNKKPMMKKLTKSSKQAAVAQSKTASPDFTLALNEENSDNDFDSNQLSDESLNAITNDNRDEFLKVFGESDDEDFSYFTNDDIGNAPAIEVPQRYPKRLCARKEKYVDDDLSDEDVYLFCEDCDEIHHGDCPVHGPLLTLDSSSGQDKASLEYTQIPVPAELSVRPSNIPQAGLGVFATKIIPPRVKFGPYKGKIVRSDDIEDGDDTSYMWKIKKNDESYYIDGQMESDSNWLRFVNCARNEDEQNLVAFQHYGNIYYRSFKQLYPETELLVWYGEQYAKDLGIPTITFDADYCETFTCKKCGDKFFSQSTFSIHLRHNKFCCKANPQVFGCLKCQEKFTELHQLQYHIRQHLVDVQNEGDENKLEVAQTGKIDHKDFKCDFCAKCFTNNSHLQTHLRIHTGDKPYKCEHCEKCFVQSSHLRIHLRVHTRERPYKCNHCDECFNQSSHLQTHLRIHTGDKPYKCEHCEECFNQIGQLQRHLRISHSGEKPYKCEHCDKSFSQISSFQRHTRIHTGDKPYKCDYCEKRFHDIGSLHSHERVHTGEKPYKCDYCEKSFSHSKNRWRHQRIHTGEKPYKCDYCGKCFNDNGNLLAHLRRIHTGDKPCKCEYCGKGFNQVGLLQVHLRTHTKDKPHKCEYCGKCFSRSCDLQRHVRIHTGDKP